MRLEIRGAEQLSFREKQVVTLKEMGLANTAVAQRLDVSLSTVATLYNRARKKGYQVVIVIEGDPLALYNDDNDSVESS